MLSRPLRKSIDKIKNVLTVSTDGEQDEKLTDDEQKMVDKAVSDFCESWKDAATRFASRLNRHGSKILRGRRLRTQGFQERLYSRWFRALDTYELGLYVAQQCGDYFNSKFRAQASANNDYQFEALIRLHAGAARVAGEVYALLLAGFASGAHARWRTLHEIATTALFLANEDKETAERYVHHRFVKSYEDAQQYQKHALRLKVKPFTARQMQRIEADYKAVLARYGPDFRKTYAWARPALERRNAALKGQKLGFEQVQAAVNIDHWTPYFRMASHAIHPSATFLRFNLGNEPDSLVLMAGPSNADLAEAGQGAMLSLSNATAALLTYRPASESLDNVKHQAAMSVMTLTLAELSNAAARDFIEAHQQLEEEIRAERKKGSAPRLSGRAPRFEKK